MLKRFLLVFVFLLLPGSVFCQEENIVNCVHRAIECLQHGKKQEAHALFNKAITYQPSSGDDYTSLGTAYYYFGNDNRAIEVYKKAIELEPKKTCAYENLSELYTFIDKYPEAQKVMHLSAHQVNPKTKNLSIGMTLEDAVRVLGEPNGISGNTDVGTCLPTPFYFLKSIEEAREFSQKENNWVDFSYDDGIRMMFEKEKLTNFYASNNPTCDYIGRDRE